MDQPPRRPDTDAADSSLPTPPRARTRRRAAPAGTEGAPALAVTGRPAGRGLRVERRFTREGVHPFDEVRWERRAAAISNEKGEVVFEQRDCEVPASWSQMATNVVVSKYFRGPLDTPRRETSVKQVISRVCDTIAGWGREGGYFATEADAQAFQDELTHLVLHQRMSFNSPVWFNIGVAGTRPQASACQPWDARVVTPRGLVPIGELVDGNAIGEEVFDRDGVTRIVATKANGRKEVFRLTVGLGITLDATADHLVLVSEDNRGRRTAWKRVDEVAAGDRLVLDSRHAVMRPIEVSAGELAGLGAPRPYAGRGRRFQQQGDVAAWMDHATTAAGDVAVAEASLAGWLQADGYVGRPVPGTSLVVEFQPTDADELAEVERLLDIAFPGVHRHVTKSHPGEDRGCHRVRLSGDVLKPFVEKWELLTRGVGMRVPSRLWGASLDEIAGYLRALFQADGYVSITEPAAACAWPAATVGLGLIAYQLCADVQQLLLTLGIQSILRSYAPARGRRAFHTVTVTHQTDRHVFAELVGFPCPRKSGLLRASLEIGRNRAPRRSVRYPRVTSIVSRGVMDVYDIQTESENYLSNHLVVHNCFINSVDDTMDSILKLAHTEGMLFKYGSGTGTNLSAIRSSKEALAGGGTASGPVSFMRGFDAFAGVIKSGGTTRRAAKMVILDAGHPDVEEFITCKVTEERKAWSLIEAGYDGSFTGEAYSSIFFQNSNNSVRVSDDFMRAVVEDREWHLRAVTDPDRIIKTVRARELMKLMAESAWQCGDPGIQYDTTINDWHTSAASGRINASNPCFPADARVHTVRGLMTFGELFSLAEAGEFVPVYTHRATAAEPAGGVLASTPVAVMCTGVKDVVRLSFSNGATLRCTPNHRLWTRNRGYVRADELVRTDEVLLNDSVTAASDASWVLPAKVEDEALAFGRGGTKARTPLPERWSEGLGELLGHLVGDGCMTDESAVWVYGGEDIATGLMASHAGLLTELVGGISEATMTNGTRQLRAGSRALRSLLGQLGISGARAQDKRLPSALWTAPPEVQASFLRGIFGADGCISVSKADGKANRHVGLGSCSRELLDDVRRLLSAFGIRARLDAISKLDPEPFSYRRADGTTVEYAYQPSYDLRITGTDVERFAEHIGFSQPRKQRDLEQILDSTGRYTTKGAARLTERVADGRELVFNLTEPVHHSYIVDGFVVANCSEYMYLDDSACNLASLNLMTFAREDGTFDVEGFRHAVHMTITAQEIVVGNASYPTPKIGENSIRFRPLGLGYANLGALLMARGVPYDSPQGRELAACVTAIMTGEAYAQSARIAREVGPFEGYAENRQPMLRVIGKHREAAYRIPDEHVEGELVLAARHAWDEAHELGAVHGYRNGQATVLAPTGCLTPDTLVTTSRGLVRLRSLGNPLGAKWQDLDVEVATHEGPRKASKFFVNGVEPVVTVETGRGYRIRGTTTHRVKVVDASGEWQWRRLADVKAGDRVPLMLGGLVGEPVPVALPPLPDAYWTADHDTTAPRYVTPELAELVGYFMGDGSLHAKELRFCVSPQDTDLAEHLAGVGRRLFSIAPTITRKTSYIEVAFTSVRLVMWWEACGFAKLSAGDGRRGKGWLAHVPDAILHTNNAAAYAAFVRGLFEADGTVSSGYPSFTTVTEALARDVQAILLALGFVTTLDTHVPGRGSWGSRPKHRLRLLNVATAARFGDVVGFASARKRALCAGSADHRQAARHDHVPMTRETIDLLAPGSDSLRSSLLTEHRRSGTVTRTAATALLERTQDTALRQTLSFFYDEVAQTSLGEEDLTLDISVPDNVTYVANGFVSHNTIGFMMDCDTTGIEPDIALVKYKKLVGGGMLKIVNQTVPQALRRLGYGDAAVQDVVAHIDANDTIEGAPHLREEDLAVFDCAFQPQNGSRSIAWQGHVRMMSAAQPFLSGAISKTVNMPSDATVDDVEQAYMDGWRLGLKALAIYRDGSKRSQPLATSIAKTTGEREAVRVVERPLRRRLPAERQAITHKFAIADHEGYITVGLYEDGTPGEIFLKMAKEGSTVSGLMDSFATAVSMALQYGVPLQALCSKFSHARFEPAGFTGNPEIPIAKSIMDYIFRWLASRFLPWEERDALGVIRRDGTEPGEEPAVETRVVAAPVAGPVASAAVAPPAAIRSRPPVVDRPAPAAFLNQEDAPSCSDCGSLMVRSGACYKCLNCGATSGCS